MDSSTPVFVAYVLLIIGSLGLWLAWTAMIGSLRGALAAGCRFLWVLPLVLALTPERVSEEMPRTMAARPIHVLLDDSPSMLARGERGSTAPMATGEALIDRLARECVRLGCAPRMTRLSEVADEVGLGFTPLADTLDPWLMKTAGDPWVVISDGGDWRPALPWESRLRGMGRPGSGKTEPRGLIVGFPTSDPGNIWITDVELPPFSFDGKPLAVGATVRRAGKELGGSDDAPELIQVQILSGGKALASANAEFRSGENAARIEIPVPPLARGQHLIEVSAVPTARETMLWDNRATASVEVLPNTIGVLHLLGSPSWDGRFLRRYLKAEPKYDIISFFILRDPWDSQQVSERELSLIPFPVERLFREELPNFRVIVLQNFTLVQFLQPEFQANLVKFVQDGGGLLFIGGPRALRVPDLASSPLREILPFSTNVAESGIQMGFPDEMEGGSPPAPNSPAEGINFDPNLRFNIELARPESHLRALANVYDDWERIGENLTKAQGLKGLHRMDRATFKADGSTPLLTARTADGKSVPLAVASYPGKGRAIWIFTDSLWRLAMTGGERAARQTAHRFMEGAMTWLMRQDLKQPLVASGLTVRPGTTSGSVAWRVELRGPATRYFRPGEDWRVRVCGAVASDTDISIDKGSADEWTLSGTLPMEIRGGDSCAFTVEGSHAAFGSVRASTAAIFPATLTDAEVGRVPQKLESLAALTGARLTLPPENPEDALVAWLDAASGTEGVALPSRFKVTEDHYWVLSRAWFFALLAFLPLEVLVRRWHLLFATSGAKGWRMRLAGRGRPRAS